ncbi:MAG: transcriptional repressor [Rhodospirillum sp.]|nr:transcriptional repressor [Rhodospirillum sp.]MCF8487991.1 transcriptional repressor [Rhodospirillum sp.]MCF8500484.1 transcriptional repressor [Rhodospirillum sp.]
MHRDRPYRPILEKLRAAGLRPTRQRLGLARLLFGGEGRQHVTAEGLHNLAVEEEISVSLATVYNSLNQFVDGGLLKEVVVESGRSYFDTNIEDHHHFYIENTGQLIDIPADHVGISHLPPIPDGANLRSVEVLIRLVS